MRPELDEPGSAPAADAALVVHALECRRGERPLFAGLDFIAAAGAIVWVRGANGQGKTTLLRTLAGLSAPAGGTVVRRGAAASWPLLYLAHANALKDDLTVGESLAFLIRLGGDDVGQAALAAALERFGMASRRDAPVRTLSQGQRRRVALARLAASPGASLWLLDEPYDALDADGVATLDAVLAAHAGAGGIVVLTSHLPLSITAPRPSLVQLGAASGVDGLHGMEPATA